jgi:hypothetical protein
MSIRGVHVRKENIQKQVNYCHVCHVLYCKDITATAKILNWVYKEQSCMYKTARYLVNLISKQKKNTSWNASGKRPLLDSLEIFFQKKDSLEINIMNCRLIDTYSFAFIYDLSKFSKICSVLILYFRWWYFFYIFYQTL